MIRSGKNARRNMPGGKNQGWEEWQRFVQKETQRLLRKSKMPVIEVCLTEPEGHRHPQQVEEDEFTQSDRYPHELVEGRRPPVPGVSREEALEVNDDDIGKTVKPFKVQDYRNIRPLTSPNIFDPVPQTEPEETESTSAAEIADYNVIGIQEAPSEQGGGENVLDDSPVITQSVHIDSPTISHDKKTEKSQKTEKEIDAVKVKKIGKKKKVEDDSPGLFSAGMIEHKTLGKKRLARKARLEREELIEKLLDPVISLDEAATLIGVCKTTVRRYTNRDELECIRTPGQQRRFKLSQVLAFVKKREEEEKARRSRATKSK